MMKNPISKMNMFASPSSIGALCDQIDQLTGSEKTIAYTYAIMMMNVCADKVNQAIEQSQQTDLTTV